MNKPTKISCSFKKRFMVSIAMLFVPVLILVVVTHFIIRNMVDGAETIEADTQKMVPLVQLQTSLLRAIMPPNDYLIHGRDDEVTNYIELSKDVENKFSRVRELNFLTDVEFAKLQATYLQWRKANNMSLEIIGSASQHQSINNIEKMEKLDALIDKIVYELDQLHEHIHLRLEKEMISMKAAESKNLLFSVVLLLICLVFFIFITFMITRNVQAPIRILREGADEFREGNLDYRIPLQREDEFGALATAFNRMADMLKSDRMRLQMLAFTDELTGLLNTREFSRQLGLELERSRRHRHNCCLLFIDIDHFKRINDKYGHAVGDIALRTAAHLIKDTLRPHDIVARYGGEEIIAILPETDITAAKNAAERIRHSMEERKFDIREDIRFNITVSIGIASYPENATDKEELVQAADKAMYAAKRAGRNRIYSYDEV